LRAWPVFAKTTSSIASFGKNGPSTIGAGFGAGRADSSSVRDDKQQHGREAGIGGKANDPMAETKKLDFIDSLRGFAALYVLVYHFSLITDPKAVAPEWLAPFTGYGGSGVTLFFVVSAFTLSLSADARRGKDANPLTDYFLRRFFRIAPLFYVWIVAYCVRDKLLFNAVHSLRDIARSALFLINLSPGHETGFVWASWTLGVEMLFYLMFPAIFRWADSIGKAGAFFLLALLLRPLWHEAVMRLVADPMVAQNYYAFSLFRHLPTFLFGIVVYRAYRLLNLDSARRLGLGYVLVGVALAAIAALAYGAMTLPSLDGLTGQAVIYGLLLLGLAVNAPAILVNRFTCFYGRISYSVYLSHATTLYLMSRIFAFVYRNSPQVTVAYAVSLCLGLAVITAISVLTYRYIETPGNSIARRIIRSRQAALACAAPPP